MSERDRYIPGVPCWIDTNQPDPEAAVAFYSGLFGWDIEDAMPAGSDAHYFMARIRGGDVAGIGPVPEGAPASASWDTYIWVESADETAGKVKAAGGKIIIEPLDVMEAGRTAVFSDPEGAVFCVWEPGRHRGATIVNEPGSLNFNTPGARGARARPPQFHPEVVHTPYRGRAPGPLYSDVIESGGSTGAATIKSHHNVGGLPEDLDFGLVEPLRATTSTPTTPTRPGRSTARCSGGRRCRWATAPRRGRYPDTATTSS